MSKDILLKTINVLKEFESIKVEIQAHTDWVGKGSANQLLSEKRAASVKRFMIENGIDEMRLVATGYGETKPIADNNTAEGRAKNRRVELKLLEQAGCLSLIKGGIGF